MKTISTFITALILTIFLIVFTYDRFQEHEQKKLKQKQDAIELVQADIKKHNEEFQKELEISGAKIIKEERKELDRKLQEIQLETQRKLYMGH
jgi:hypothetical protein